jgi:hypothetical protein
VRKNKDKTEGKKFFFSFLIKNKDKRVSPDSAITGKDEWKMGKVKTAGNPKAKCFCDSEKNKPKIAIKRA